MLLHKIFIYKYIKCTYAGHVGFVGDLIIWSDVLSDSDVSALSKRGPPSLAKDIADITEVLRNTPHTAEMPSSNEQIADVSSALDMLLNPQQSAFRSNLDSNLITTTLDSCASTTEEGTTCAIVESAEATAAVVRINEIMDIAQSAYPIPIRLFDLSDTIDETFLNAKHGEAQEAFNDCADVRTRIDRYEEAAMAGGAAANGYLVNWAALHLFGSEAADNRCGLSDIPFDNTTAAAVLNRHVSVIRALVRASAYGSYKGLVLLSSAMISGLSAVETYVDLYAPKDSNICELCAIRGRKSIVECPMEIHIACKLRNAINECNSTSTRKDKEAVSSQDSDVTISSMGSAHCLHAGSQDGVLRLSIQLLHIAALGGGKIASEAYVALAHRYVHGLGVPRDVETGAYYMSVAATASSIAFHAIGGQPIIEADRINDATEKSVSYAHMYVLNTLSPHANDKWTYILCNI